jgi:hypothetical protein
MKALSVRQPWAWLILHGKDIENRNWPTKYRGPLLIHASMKYDYEGAGWVKENFPKIKLPSLFMGEVTTGAILGKVEVVDCVAASKSKWFFGPYGFVLRNPVEFEKPIPFKGMLGLFDVPDKLLGKVQ